MSFAPKKMLTSHLKFGRMETEWILKKANAAKPEMEIGAKAKKYFADSLKRVILANSIGAGITSQEFASSSLTN